MFFTFHPQRSDDVLTLSKAGDTLTLNGEVFDFSDVPEGGTLPASAIKSAFFGGPVTRQNGEIHVHILLPHSEKANAACRSERRVRCSPDGPVKFHDRGEG